jgi:hypothetical protein
MWLQIAQIPQRNRSRDYGLGNCQALITEDPVWSVNLWLLDSF